MIHRCSVASHVLTVPLQLKMRLALRNLFLSIIPLNYLFLRIFNSSNPEQVSIRFFRHYYSYFFVPIDLYLFVAFCFRFAVTSLLYPLAHSPCAAVSIESMSGELAALETEIKEYRLQVGSLLLQPSQGTELSRSNADPHPVVSSRQCSQVSKQIRRIWSCRISKLSLKKSLPSPTLRSQS